MKVQRFIECPCLDLIKVCFFATDVMPFARETMPRNRARGCLGSQEEGRGGQSYLSERDLNRFLRCKIEKKFKSDLHGQIRIACSHLAKTIDARRLQLQLPEP